MLRKVKLYGHLGEKYGEEHMFDISSAPEAARALSANYKEFFDDFKDGQYQIVLGDKKYGTELSSDTLEFQLGKCKEVHIIPVAAGSGGGNGTKIVIGLALLAPFTFGASAVFLGGAGTGIVGAGGLGLAASTAAATTLGIGGVTYGTLASIGLSLVAGGIAGLLTQPPKTDYGSLEPADQNASFLFNGPTNRGKEGTAIPIVYGTMRVGSVLISSGITIEQLIPDP